MTRLTDHVFIYGRTGFAVESTMDVFIREQLHRTPFQPFGHMHVELYLSCRNIDNDVIGAMLL